MKQKIALISFLLAIFLIKLPPIYILPIQQSKLFTTHVIAKVMISGGFLLLLMVNKTIKRLVKNSSVTIVVFYFLTQSLSIIRANDIFLFLNDYQNLIASLLIFLAALIISERQKNKEIFYSFILLVGTLIVMLEYVFYFFPNQFISFIGNFVQKEVLTLYSFNLQRGRYNLYLNTELFLPFFISLFLSTDKNKFKKNTLLIIVSLLIFLTFISNFRHRFLFLFFILVFYGIFLSIKRSIVNLRGTLVVFLAIFFLLSISLSFFVVRTFSQRDIVDRLLLQDEAEDVYTVNSRIDNFNRSIDLISSSPLFGIGLGNYQLYTNNKAKFSTIDQLSREFHSDSIKDPHSIISKTIGETGLIGIFGWIVMVIFFIRKDYFSLKTKRISLKFLAYIVSFWGLFILSLITPSLNIFRGGWMWFLRGAIESSPRLTNE